MCTTPARTGHEVASEPPLNALRLLRETLARGARGRCEAVPDQSNLPSRRAGTRTRERLQIRCITADLLWYLKAEVGDAAPATEAPNCAAIRAFSTHRQDSCRMAMGSNSFKAVPKPTSRHSSQRQSRLVQGTIYSCAPRSRNGLRAKKMVRP